jgi:hypothetical protein
MTKPSMPMPYIWFASHKQDLSNMALSRSCVLHSEALYIHACLRRPWSPHRPIPCVLSSLLAWPNQATLPPYYAQWWRRYAALVRGEGETRIRNRKPLEWLPYHLQTSINQTSAAPLVGASLSLSKFKKQIMSVQKSQVKKHIHKPSVLLNLRTLTTDQNESTFNVR